MEFGRLLGYVVSGAAVQHYPRASLEMEAAAPLSLHQGYQALSVTVARGAGAGLV